jgi:AcrR family transcriptional regulator
MARPAPALPARAPRFRRRRDARPAEIIEAALAVFVERGFAAARLDDIAKRAGVTKGTLYLYFADKQALLRAVVETHVVPRVRAVQAVLADPRGSAAAVLAAAIENWIQVLQDERLSAMPKLIIGEAGNFPDFARYYVTQVIEPGLAALAGAIARGVEQGEFRRVDPVLAARLLVAPMVFMALWKHSFARHASRAIDVATMAREHLAMFLRGLAPEETTP